MNPTNTEIVIYQTDDGQARIDVRMENETVWLTQAQMTELFQSTKQNISLHINNAFAEGELAPEATVKEYLTVQTEGKRQVSRNVQHYNLDVIISVGYRVKSLRGTQFRRWATSILRDHLLKGYSLNRERLAQLNQTLEIISRSEIAEISGVASVIKNYTAGLDLLDNYDHQRLPKPSGAKSKWHLTYDEARAFVNSMKFAETSALFGNEKDESFKSAMGAIYQNRMRHSFTA